MAGAIACAGVLAAVLAGCAGAVREDIAAPTVSPPTDWFCEATGGEWDCIEEDEVGVPTKPGNVAQTGAAAPRPSNPDAVPAAGREAAAPERRPLVADRPRPARDRQVAGAGQRGDLATGSVTENRATGGDAAGDPEETEQIPPSVAPREDAPLYRQLAYVPAASVPLTDLPADFYIVQLIALSSREKLEQYVQERDLWGFSAARVERDGALHYVLLLGVYRNRDDAERAARALPQTLADVTPWIRPMYTLQAAMLRGDRLAGTPDV